MFRSAALAVLALVSVSCSSLPVPGPSGSAPQPGAAALLRESAARQGDSWRKNRIVRVAYTGDWSRSAVQLQPVLTDAGFRKSSIEIYQPRKHRVSQTHRGPSGVKSVTSRVGAISVAYNGNPSTDLETLASSALVADAYTAFLFGPSWLAAKADQCTTLGVRTLDGEPCDLVAGRLLPGFGSHREDHFIAWIGRETKLLRRLQFSLNALESTRGADVDVTFSGHRKARDGSVWPTSFVEYIHRPLLLKAHEWRMTSLTIDGRKAW